MRTLPFTEADVHAAVAEWNCNCGPTALAFALGITLDKVRPAIPTFEERCYTNSNMMKAALGNLGTAFEMVKNPACGREYEKFGLLMYHEQIALVRIQFTGPWIVDGKPQRWAARQSHWVACWREDREQRVFDINSGIVTRATWEVHVVPSITKTIKRADGGWYPTNIWRIGAINAQ